MWTCITEYYFEGPGYEILTLRQGLNQIMQQALERAPEGGDTKGGAYGKLGLGHIWKALGKPEGISSDGALIHRIQAGDCYLLRNGKWAMALQVWNGDFRDLWDAVLQKWAPHCRYYYLICGDVVESNDIKRKYFTWDYVTQIAFSRQTPEEIRKVFEPYADHRFTIFEDWSDSFLDNRYTYWHQPALKQLLLKLLPRPDLEMYSFLTQFSQKMHLSGLRMCYSTYITICPVHYVERREPFYTIPALEQMRKQGLID